jgi:UDP:flavonoid glycosyltransferase YjiC (YdhE family)
MGGRLPDNARAAEFLPYEQLLPRTDVVVSNGGFGGVQQALSYGLPLVVAGATEDKPEVAARVAWSGAGVNLRTGAPSPARVRRAVRSVLTEPRYRGAAQRLQLEIAELRDPVVVIAETLEDLVPSSEATPPRVTVAGERRTPQQPLLAGRIGD